MLSDNISNFEIKMKTNLNDQKQLKDKKESDLDIKSGESSEYFMENDSDYLNETYGDQEDFKLENHDETEGELHYHGDGWLPRDNDLSDGHVEKQEKKINCRHGEK